MNTVDADGVGGLVQHGGWFDFAVVVLHVSFGSALRGQRHRATLESSTAKDPSV